MLQKLVTRERAYLDETGQRVVARDTREHPVPERMFAPTAEGPRLLGIEVELITIDAASLRPIDWAEKPDLPEGAEIHPELNREVVELAFDRGYAFDELRNRTAMSLAAVRSALRSAQKGVLPWSYHPLSALGPPNPHPFIQYMMRRQGILPLSQIGFTGLQFHREFGTLAEGLRLHNVLRLWLHYLTVLTLCSPFVGGKYRGMCSERIPAKRNNVLGGIPPRLPEDVGAFLEYMQQMIDEEVFEGPCATNYDLRPPRVHTGTVETNVQDICPDVGLWFAVLDLFDRLCEAIRLHKDRPLPADLLSPDVPETIAAHNRHRTAWKGTEATLLDGKGKAVAARDALARLFHFLERDCGLPWNDLESGRTLEEVLANGSPAQRLIKEYEALSGKRLPGLEETELDSAVIAGVMRRYAWIG
jgi:gamma-glutamyl:cysteine ligase YbdK (ATP-grasp superfamily)